jgi:hypothetical protein
MPGRGTVPGETYPECSEPGHAGRRRHKAEGTRTCQLCREKTRDEMAAYRKAVIIGGPRRVPALGSQRRIRALVRMGWSQRRLGARLGITGKAVGDVLTYRYVNQAYAERIRELYWQLIDLPGPDLREARAAQRAGWPGPGDWDDIDDPGAIPVCEIERAHGEALKIHRAYRKMLSKRTRRAQMSEEQRRAACEEQRQRRERRTSREGTAA